LGELKKLGMHKISRNTVKNILRDNGLDPGPKRGQGTWDEFLKRHAQSLWACDFFSAKVWTLGGLVDIFVLFFIHIGTRRVHLAGLTAHPNRAWVVQQARNLSMVFAEEPVKPRMLLRDHDSKFVPEFDQVFESDGIEVNAVGPLAPNMNPHAERWVQAVKQECLAHFVIFGEAHLRHLLTEFLTYYHQERPHQALGNVPPCGSPSVATDLPVTGTDIVCEERLGGLLKHYRRKPAA
jgi:putative transposase